MRGALPGTVLRVRVFYRRWRVFVLVRSVGGGGVQW